MARQKFSFNPQVVSSSAPSALEEHSTAPSAVEQGTTISVAPILEKLNDTSPKSVLDKFKVIPRHKIRTNKKNSYPKHSLDSLKESILFYDIQQDITVIYILEEDMYVIESGHRRTAALDELIKEFKDYEQDTDDERYKMYQKNIKKYEKGYVCKIVGSIKDDIQYDYAEDEELDNISDDVIDSEIRLHITNIEARNDSPADRAKNIQRLAKLYERKNKDKPRKEQININKQIAADTNLGERQVAYYKSISSLIPELMTEFENNNISLKEGSMIAKLNIEEQQTILELVQKGNKKEEILSLVAEKQKLQKQVTEKETCIQKLEAEKEELLSSSAPSAVEPNHDLEEKDNQINSLKDEIENLKLQKNKISTLDNDTRKLVATELQLKTTLTHAKTVLSNLNELGKSYKILYNKADIPSDYSLLSLEEYQKECEQLKNILNQREKP